jgi:hypothetical protein
MAVTVFLSNTNIQIVVGSGSAAGANVKRLVSVSIPNGAVLNGVVMDENALVAAIKECWKINKLPKGDVTLILNSPQLRANFIDLPVMPDKKTTEYVQRETKDARLSKPVSSWYLVERNPKLKTQKIVSETADAQFIDTYVSIFQKAGIRLIDIHDGVTRAINLLKGATRNKTVVYMILDGTSLVTIFFEKGMYYYHSTKRVFNQPGSSEFAREIFSAISEIRQFASVQKLEDAVEEIQFAGLGEQQVSRLAEDMGDIDSNIKLSAVSCPSYVKSKNNSKQFPYFVYPIAGLTKISAARFDIMTANRKSADKFIRKHNLLKVVVPAAGFLLLLGIIYGALSAVTYLQQKQLSDLIKENSNPTILANVNKYERMADVVTGVGGRQGGLNILHKYLDSYPIPDSKVNTLISDAAFKYSVKVIVNSYDSASGVFSITAQASEVELINQFIADLMKMDNFEKVDYTGYTAIKEKDGTSGWQINVVCALAARNTDAKKAEGDA